MATYSSISALLKGLQQSAKLLNDMFMKGRINISIRYDDAIDVLDGDEHKLKQLIHFGVIAQTDNLLELDDTYQNFFERVLEINEEINISLVQTYINKLTLDINSYLAADNNSRRNQYIQKIRHTLRSIESTTRRNVVDLKRNVDDTYKQEPNFKIKELRLKDFDDKTRLIKGLIAHTEKIIEEQTIFFTSAANSGLKQTVSDVKSGLIESSHELIFIQAQIIDYLNRIEYQNKVVKKIRQLKYLKDQMMIEDSTDIKKVLAKYNDVWFEKHHKYRTWVSIDFLRNDDDALVILNDIQKRLNKKVTLKARLAPKIEEQFLNEEQETQHAFNHQEIINGFIAQGDDLFAYVWNYNFEYETDAEMRLVLFLQLASQYDNDLRFTTETNILNNIEYPIIYPL